MQLIPDRKKRGAGIGGFDYDYDYDYDYEYGGEVAEKMRPGENPKIGRVGSA